VAMIVIELHFLLKFGS